MINIAYHAGKKRGNWNRSVYRRILPLLVQRPVLPSRAVPLAVYSMSCERDLPEQAASIYSFLRHAGLPDRFTVVSDGSHSEQSIGLLKRISPCVNVVDIVDVVTKELPEIVQAYAASSPMGKKLALEISLPVQQTTMYVDADVLFFPAAKELADLCFSDNDQPWYLPDLPGALDGRLIQGTAEEKNPVNGGFMVLKKPLNWKVALERLSQLSEAPGYFTEQTLLHLTMHYNHAIPLCRNKFVLQRDDQFQYSDAYAGRNIALRHYVSTVRHKFWFRSGWL